MPETIPQWLLVGLWAGGRANRELESRKPDKDKTLGERARGMFTRGIVSAWKWNRGRQKKAKERERNRKDEGET